MWLLSAALVIGGELLGADHHALHVFQRHQQVADRTASIFRCSPLSLDHWEPDHYA